MKNNRIGGEKRNFALLLLVLLLLLTVPFFMSGCEPGGWLTIENQHSQAVGIYYSHVQNDGTTDEATYQITIQPNETRELGIVLYGSGYIKRIEALDPSGKVVFSHDYKMADLENMHWKIVILP